MPKKTTVINNQKKNNLIKNRTAVTSAEFLKNRKVFFNYKTFIKVDNTNFETERGKYKKPYGHHWFNSKYKNKLINKSNLSLDNYSYLNISRWYIDHTYIKKNKISKDTFHIYDQLRKFLVRIPNLRSFINDKFFNLGINNKVKFQSTQVENKKIKLFFDNLIFNKLFYFLSPASVLKKNLIKNFFGIIYIYLSKFNNGKAIKKNKKKVLKLFFKNYIQELKYLQCHNTFNYGKFLSFDYHTANKLQIKNKLYKNINSIPTIDFIDSNFLLGLFRFPIPWIIRNKDSIVNHNFKKNKKKGYYLRKEKGKNRLPFKHRIFNNKVYKWSVKGGYSYYRWQESSYLYLKKYFDDILLNKINYGKKYTPKFFFTNNSFYLETKTPEEVINYNKPLIKLEKFEQRRKILCKKSYNNSNKLFFKRWKRKFPKSIYSIVFSYTRSNYFFTVIHRTTGEVVQSWSSGKLGYEGTREKRSFFAYEKLLHKVCFYIKNVLKQQSVRSIKWVNNRNIRKIKFNKFLLKSFLWNFKRRYKLKYKYAIVMIKRPHSLGTRQPKPRRK